MKRFHDLARDLSAVAHHVLLAADMPEAVIFYCGARAGGATSAASVGAGARTGRAGVANLIAGASVVHRGRSSPGHAWRSARQ